MLWAAPFAGGLLLAVPFAVLTADLRLGRWLRRQGIAAMPEEIVPHAGDKLAAAPVFDPR